MTFSAEYDNYVIVLPKAAHERATEIIQGKTSTYFETGKGVLNSSAERSRVSVVST